MYRSPSRDLFANIDVDCNGYEVLELVSGERVTTEDQHGAILVVGTILVITSNSL